MNNKKNNSNSEKSEGPLKGASIDQLSGRLGEVEGVEQDIAAFFAVNWQKFAGTLLLIVIAIYLYDFYRNTQLNRRGEESFRLQEVQKAFQSLIVPSDITEPAEGKSEEEEKKSAEEKTAKLKAFQDNIKLLAESSDSAYGDFASLYKAAFDMQNQQVSAAKQFTESKKINPDDQAWSPTQGVDQERVLKELASLLFARVLLTEDSEAGREKAREYLLAILPKCSFVTNEGLLLLARISQGQEELEVVSKLANQIISERPDLAENIKLEMENAGLSLD